MCLSQRIPKQIKKKTCYLFENLQVKINVFSKKILRNQIFFIIVNYLSTQKQENNIIY